MDFIQQVDIRELLCTIPVLIIGIAFIIEEVIWASGKRK